MSLAAWISADYSQAAVVAHPFVPYSGWKHEHVSSFQSDQPAGFSSQPEGYLAGRYTENFVGVRMEVCVVIDGVRPDSSPSIFLKRSPEDLGFCGSGGAKHGAKNERGQAAVWDFLALLEIQSLW
jgi:hypothetical protein